MSTTTTIAPIIPGVIKTKFPNQLRSVGQEETTRVETHRQLHFTVPGKCELAKSTLESTLVSLAGIVASAKSAAPLFKSVTVSLRLPDKEGDSGDLFQPDELELLTRLIAKTLELPNNIDLDIKVDHINEGVVLFGEEKRISLTKLRELLGSYLFCSLIEAVKLETEQPSRANNGTIYRSLVNGLLCFDDVRCDEDDPGPM